MRAASVKNIPRVKREALTTICSIHWAGHVTYTLYFPALLSISPKSRVSKAQASSLKVIAFIPFRWCGARWCFMGLWIMCLCASLKLDMGNRWGTSPHSLGCIFHSRWRAELA
ncbi:hypothetical protein F5878DRAFT_604426, partial [Lentinula raphanica]